MLYGSTRERIEYVEEMACAKVVGLEHEMTGVTGLEARRKAELTMDKF